MTIARRRVPALAIISLLVVVLAACSVPAESTGTSEPGSTDSSETSSPGAASDSPTDSSSDSPTDEPSGAETSDGPVFTAVAPAPRLPVTCAQLFSSLPGVTGANVINTVNGYAQEAALAQVGFIDCELNGTLSSLPVVIRAVVGVEIPRSTVTPRVNEERAAGHPTGLGAELSYSDCGFVDDALDCWSGVYANGYFAEIKFSRGSWTNTPAFDAATLKVTSELAARVASWGSPAPAWKAPSDALRWATECETEVASTDSAIVAAMPTPVASPRNGMPDSGFALMDIGLDRAGFTFCEWAGDLGASILVVPGASWYFTQPGILEGPRYPYPDALATFYMSSLWQGYPTSTLHLVVDDSFVLINVGADGGSAPIPLSDVPAIVFDIADAVVDEFGSR